MVFGKPVAWSLAALFLITSLFSTFGSSAGAYLSSLEATGHHQRQERAGRLAALDQAHTRELSALSSLIDQAETAASNIGAEIEALRSRKTLDGGKMVADWASGKKAASLSSNLAAANEKVSALGEQNLAAIKQYEEQKATIEEEYSFLSSTTLFGSTSEGVRLAWLVAIVIGLGEFVNMFAHWYRWRYSRMAHIEGVQMQVIAPSGEVIEEAEEPEQEQPAEVPADPQQANPTVETVEQPAPDQDTIAAEAQPLVTDPEPQEVAQIGYPQRLTVCH